MPTYEYECTSCHYRFEEFQSMNDEPLKTCPKCKKAAKRLFSPGAGLIFKGKGFYQTDYKNSASGRKNENGDKNKPSKCGGSGGSCPCKNEDI